jgi:hypothetical protein
MGCRQSGFKQEQTSKMKRESTQYHGGNYEKRI